MSSTPLITPQEAASRTATALFLDVRTPAEHEEIHIGGAILHPLSELNNDTVRNLMSGKTEGIVVCRSGGRARQAYEKLAASGLSSLKVLDGGMTAWEVAGLPVVRGKKTISLERQVRIAAGSLVLVGSIFGYFIHPTFIALSAFVGAGLVFAGVTDTCGLAMVLARMPWNNRKAAGSSCCVSKSSCS